MGCTGYWITHLVSSGIVIYGVSKLWSWSGLDNAKFLQLVFPSLNNKKGFPWSKIKGHRTERSIHKKPPPSTQKRLKLLSPPAGVFQGRATSLLNAASLIVSWICPEPSVSVSIWSTLQSLGLFISPSSSTHKDEKTQTCQSLWNIRLICIVRNLTVKRGSVCSLCFSS